MKMQIIIILGLASSLAVAGWLLKSAYEDIGKLKVVTENLEANNQSYLNALDTLRQERKRVDSLYQKKTKENEHVQNNAQQQLQAIDAVTADACADAFVTDDRLIILQQPIWQAMPSTHTGTTITPSVSH